MFARANDDEEDSAESADGSHSVDRADGADGSNRAGRPGFKSQEPLPEAHEGDRRGMYQCGKTGVTIASGGHDDPRYIVVMPDGTVHDAGLEEDDYLDIGTVQELLDLYNTQVY